MKKWIPSLSWNSWFQTSKDKEVSHNDTSPFGIKVSVPWFCHCCHHLFSTFSARFLDSKFFLLRCGVKLSLWNWHFGFCFEFSIRWAETLLSQLLLMMFYRSWKHCSEKKYLQINSNLYQHSFEVETGNNYSSTSNILGCEKYLLPPTCANQA